ncbi:MAG: hypothetical protein KatS3mg029_0980 [Saprospiraceae bacterium]|nr:MAG: hypothetical protein KatS3mg029_0980 [Saprospiraceae bacterium]
MRKNEWYQSKLRQFLCLLGCMLTVAMLPALAQQGNFEEPFDTLGRENRIQKAAAAIEALHDGVLIVRLSSNQRKIEALSGQLATPNLSEKQRLRLQQQLDQTRQLTRTENEGLVRAFRKYFDFTKVLFMYDTAVWQLRQGRQSGFFLDDSLRVDPRISLENKPWRMARYGSSSGMSTRKSIAALDRKFRELPPPFPHSGDVSFWEGVVLIFKKKKKWEDDYHFHVSRFNDQLHRFYNKCRQKGWLDNQ